MKPAAVLAAMGAAGILAGCSRAAPLAGPPDGGGPSGALVAACPAGPPAAGSACTERALDCEYGDDWSPQCNRVAQCWRGGALDGTWQYVDTAAAGACPTPTTADPACATVVDGAPCGEASPFCPSGAGRAAACICFGYQSSAADAGVDFRWTCQRPPDVGCPDRRPRVGSPCASEGLYCSYAACSRGGSTSCSDGAWRLGVTPNLCAGG